MEKNNTRLHNIIKKANFYFRSKDYKGAVHCYDQALQIAPNCIHALH